MSPTSAAPKNADEHSDRSLNFRARQQCQRPELGPRQHQAGLFFRTVARLRLRRAKKPDPAEAEPSPLEPTCAAGYIFPMLVHFASVVVIEYILPSLPIMTTMHLVIGLNIFIIAA